MRLFIKTTAIILGAIATLGAAGAASAHPWHDHRPHRVIVVHHEREIWRRPVHVRHVEYRHLDHRADRLNHPIVRR